MYKVGFRGDAWVLITDGNEIYCADGDLRHHSEPPELVTWLNAARPEQAGNRISSLQMSPIELEKYCVANDIWLNGRLPISESCKSLYVPAIVGATIGAYSNGFSGAAIGAGICSLLAYAYAPDDHEFSKIFSRGKQRCLLWGERDKAQIELNQENLVKYQKIAIERWCRFHKLRNISCLDALSGVEFEVAIANLYRRKGFQVEITKASGDFGVDVLATKDSESLAIQVKRYSSKVGIAAVQEVAAGVKYYGSDVAVVVTNSFFTEQAKTLAKTLRVRLIDKKGLADFWDNAYAEIPPEFNMQDYDALKVEIGTELHQLESRSAGRPKRKFVTRR